MLEKIELDYPIEILKPNAENKLVKTKLSHLELKRVKVKHIKAISNITSEKEAEFALAAQITDLTAEDLDLLDIVDYLKVQEYLQKVINKKKM